MVPNELTPENLIHERERVYFVSMLVVGLTVYGILALVSYTAHASGATILFYVALFALGGFAANAYALGRVRGNAVLVGERQFSTVHQLVATHAQRLGMSYVPTVYVMQSGGILNAFATKLLGRKFIIIYAEVLALAVQKGNAAVSFIVAHEVGHHWRGHLNWRWLTLPGRIIPYLGAAYSRSCEYTCDRVGAYCEPNGAIDGLLVLAAGSSLHSYVNAGEFAKQAEGDTGFWIRRAELVSTHPRLPKRVAALLALGIPSNAAQQMPSAA